MDNKKKNSGLEFLRLIATIGVVFCHIGVCWIHYYADEASIADSIIYNSLTVLNHWPVPIFMAITGALMLNKDICTYRGVWKYFKRISILVFIFGTLFAWIELYFKNHQISFENFYMGFWNMFTGNSWKHLWYLRMLLGIYLVLPIICTCKDRMSNTTIAITLLIILLFSSILPLINLDKLFVDYPVNSIYIVYLCMGFALFQVKNQKNVGKFIGDKWLFCILLLLSIMPICITYWYVINDLDAAERVAWYTYTSPLVVLQSLILFYLVVKRSDLFDGFCNHWLILRFNRCSLGIYIIHMLWINLAIKFLHINLMDYGYWAFMVGGIAIFIVSWGSTEIMIRMPILKRYL